MPTFLGPPRHLLTPAPYLDLLNLPGVFLSPDDPGTGVSVPPKEEPPAEKPEGEKPAPQPTAGGAEKPEPTPAERLGITPEIQAHFNAVLANERRVIEAKADDKARHRIETETQKAQAAAQRKQDEEQGQWQKVADSRRTEIETKDAELAALRPKAERYDAFVTAEGERINERVKKFHPRVQAFDPGPDPEQFEARLAWLPKAEEAQKDYDLLAKTYDPDFGKGGSRGGAPSNVFDQVRAEQAEKQKAAAEQGGTFTDRLANRGLISTAR